MTYKKYNSVIYAFQLWGDWLKFSDVSIATASINLIGLTLESVLMAVFVPLNSNMMSDTLAFVIGFLVASLIVGYVFALKIQEEARIRAVGVINVLSTFYADAIGHDLVCQSTFKPMG